MEVERVTLMRMVIKGRKSVHVNVDTTLLMFLCRALTWDVANKSVLRQVFSGAQCDSFKKGMRPWNFQGKSVDQDGFEVGG
eukprot:466454-Pelagomonas_calceolata.AAC.3